MRNFFNLDNPFFAFMADLTDLILLNIIFLFTCIPVITIGASISALHYVTLKKVKKEDGYVFQEYWKSFKENFKQATGLWLIYVLFLFFFLMDLSIFQMVSVPKILPILIGAVFFFVQIAAMYVFVLQCRFYNPIFATLKNGLLMSILNIGWTLLLLVIYAFPFVIMFRWPFFIGVYILIGAAGPAFVASFIWKHVLKKYEPAEDVEEVDKDEMFHLSNEE